jgi:hypothetical protein
MVGRMRTARAAQRVRNALLSVPGVVWVEAVLDPGLVRVAHDPGRIDPQELSKLLGAREPDYPARFLLLVRPAGAQDELQTTNGGACEGLEDS